MMPSQQGMLDLPEVTLIAASSIALPATIRAMHRSMACAKFGRAILFSDRLPEGIDLGEIEWRQIARLSSRQAYSRFMLQELFAHVPTSHALCVQWDGYVLDPRGWDDEFLAYDYIGAPWPHFVDGMTVGNGGFSLRSRRLMEVCAGMEWDCAEAEDVTICRRWRPELEQRHGLRFAPFELARRFAYERLAPEGREFGFHGMFNLVSLLGNDELVALVRKLEPNALAQQEHREVLRWAVRSGRWHLAAQMLSRMVRRKLASGGPVLRVSR